MDENFNVENVAETAVEDETVQAEQKFIHVDKSKRIFDIVYLALCSAFMLVMWCTGYNFLPLVADILGIVAGVLVFARLLSKRTSGFIYGFPISSACADFSCIFSYGARKVSGRTSGTISCSFSFPFCLRLSCTLPTNS